MAVQISGNDITVPRDGTFSRNVSIAGTLTYEDVTNVDSIGLVTARNGIEVGASPGVAASISVDGNMIVSGISTFGGDVQVPDKIIHAGDTNTAIRFPASDTVSVETGGTEALRVDSSQRTLIGHNSSLAIGGGDNSPLQVSATSSVVFGGARYVNSSSGPFISLAKSRAASAGSNTIVQDGDDLGTVLFAGDDGTDLISKGAQIQGQVDGTPGSNDMPGRLTFSTTADGAVSPTERARIESAGNVKIEKNLNVVGVCTATSFSGSGANLTGISAGVLKMALKLDGTRATYAEVVSGNNFTDARNLSGLSITMTPTDATTIFLITGNIYATHSPSYMGKGYVTTEISGGSEQMIAGNGDSSHRATFPISDGDAGTGWTGTGKNFTLFYDHNTTSAVTFRVRVATTNSSYYIFYNRGQDGATNDNDGTSMISSFMVQEIDSSIFTGTDYNNIYRGT